MKRQKYCCKKLLILQFNLTVIIIKYIFLNNFLFNIKYKYLVFIFSNNFIITNIFIEKAILIPNGHLDFNFSF